MPNKESMQSVIERCAEIEREMTALTKELRQKTDDLKAFFKMYDEKHEKLNNEWNELFDAISDDDAARKDVLGFDRRYTKRNLIGRKQSMKHHLAILSPGWIRTHT